MQRCLTGPRWLSLVRELIGRPPVPRESYSLQSTRLRCGIRISSLLRSSISLF